MIPYSHQSIDEDDIAAVSEVLRGEWLTQGPYLEAFEVALAETVGARFAVAVSSGTAALHAAAAAAGLGPGDVLATTPLSFNASAACATWVGAAPALVDIDPKTLNLDLTAVPECDALVAVHYAGLPVDLRNLTTRPRIVIEDAAHALGAITPDGPVGNCAHSDMCVLSFHPVKAITTAEGGAVTTNDPELADRVRTFRHHGIRRRPDLGGWAYDIPSVGLNYRLSDLHAALGTNQLGKLERFVTRRNELAARYRELLDGTNVVLPPAAGPGWRHGYHLFAVQVPRRREVYDALRAQDINVQVHYVPIYCHPMYDGLFDAADYPNTEAVYAGLLSLPLYPDLTDADQDTVVRALLDVVQ